ncbi:bestrophin family protein [Spirosoma aerophilum]
MNTTKRMPLRIETPYAWRAILFFALYSFSICALYSWTGWTVLAFPFVPVATVGVVIAIYIGIRNNYLFKRLLEGRRIWENLVNTSRSWGIQVVDYINAIHPVDELSTNNLYSTKQILIYRHIAYLNALRIQLQSYPFWQPPSSQEMNAGEAQPTFNQGQLDKELSLFLYDDEVEFFVNRQNPAAQIIKRQSKQLKELHMTGLLSDSHHIEMERLLMELYAQQGAAECIKWLSFPKRYAYFSNVFLSLFVAVLPFSLLAEMGKISSWHLWLTVPLYTVIAWIIYTLEISGEINMNPFDNSFNDLPIATICRSIEIDLREMLGETELPQQLYVENAVAYK